ncbi:PucR family transcriptional regulator [Nocardioides sp. B-3]|uniref:PucR family transcriptional regulator n=1 Tax=Nocardioides sp. B-3 TaxID=2895565 RepID=UPI0021539572|nr:PucR family transcriptional regulator [Nocardioides sp. B-3]UUZ59042.1 PucR family transcriptional regulator [Nocardioides sp. B-3]
MITASGLADALTSAFITLVQGDGHIPVRELEMIEPGDSTVVETGDPVPGVGARDIDDVADLVQRARDASGLVLRDPWVGDVRVQKMCVDAGLSLLAVVPDVTRTAAIRLLRSTLDTAASTRRDEGAADHVYHDLFEMADKIGTILGAPVTIEDPASRVLAYSTGQAGVDEARMSTIVGRQVPRQVREHFRALGVFRRLASSDAAVFVPAGEAGVKARFVVPVRAGGEWLGSVWAVMEEPAPAARARELRAATEVVALYLLRIRAQSELQLQVHLDQIRTVLKSRVAGQPSWLAPGPWRVAVLSGPVVETPAEARCQLWQALTRRRGWRQPLIADIDDAVYALLQEEGAGVGSWAWLRELVREESTRNSSLLIVAGGPVDSVAEVTQSRAAADELMRLSPDSLEHPVASPGILMDRTGAGPSGCGARPQVLGLAGEGSPRGRGRERWGPDRDPRLRSSTTGANPVARRTHSESTPTRFATA